MLLQRPHRGSRVASFYPVKDLPPLAALDSAFQLQEYISLLIRRDVHDVDTIVALPARPREHDETTDSPEHDAKKPDDGDRKSDISVDRACWIYEQLRRLAQDLSHPLITMLQQECTRSSCPQMKAGEWLYLCVAHGNDGAMEQCCAIDYILHTVDSATALLNSPRAFPSRLSIPQTSHRHFSSLARRLGRIFAHAYFHHREAFEQAEAESSLYARFLKLTNQFDLVPAEFLVIPETAIHHDDKVHTDHVEAPRLLSTAVHPPPVPQNDVLVAEKAADVDSSVETLNVGTESPRKLGRSRTDTMVFSEGFNVAEELSRSEEGGPPSNGSLLDISLSGSRPDLEARTEDLDDEDIGDARSDLTLAAGSLSPPVEELSLISLEDSSGASVLHEPAVNDGPSGPLPQGSLSDNATLEPPPEGPVQATNPPNEHEPSTPEVVEPSSEETATAASELPTDLLVPEESAVELVGQRGEPTPSSSNTEPEDTASELPKPEPVFELNEPPPTEPIPPESESDITDEAGGLDGNEVKEGGEEAVVGE